MGKEKGKGGKGKEGENKEGRKGKGKKVSVKGKVGMNGRENRKRKGMGKEKGKGGKGKEGEKREGRKGKRMENRKRKGMGKEKGKERKGRKGKLKKRLCNLCETNVGGTRNWRTRRTIPQWLTQPEAMGNLTGKGVGEGDDENRSLNISRRPTPKQFLKHTSGEFIEGCLLALPWEIYYNTISLYEKVNASFNFINAIPEELSLHVPHLRYLDLSHNQLNNLPTSFHLLLHLRTLHLSYNRFHTVPECLMRLPKLHTLSLANNALTELPVTIANLKHLKKLNVSNNQLRALPGSLTELPDLSVLVTLGNDLIHPPQAICDLGSETTLQYLRERHTPQPTQLSSAGRGVGVFVRVRGQQVAASVTNPGSASMEYRQAQGATSRTNKRKCPLMPPASASSLSPDQLTDTLLGLFYGLAMGDAMGLSTEGLSADECVFHYNPDTLSLDNRICDYLRSHFPQEDWSSCTDVVLLLLDSVMRWGGVVDELEFGSAVEQWLMQGSDSFDPRPGHPLSPYTLKVVSKAGYSANPHGAAHSVYTHIKDERARGIYNANPSDNSCLPTALVLGVPSFYLSYEVEMNAERICRATHADGVARAACSFLALFISSILQGKISDECASLSGIIGELRDKVLEQLPDKHDQENLVSAFQHHNNHDNGKTSDDALTSISLLVRALALRDDPQVSEREVRSTEDDPGYTREVSSTEEDPGYKTEIRSTQDDLSSEGDLGIKRQVKITKDDPPDFKREVTSVVMMGGKGVCGHASVVGGVLGALMGYSRLPQDWLAQLPQNNIKALNTKLNLLLDLFGLP
ncbi:hypothetical protein Pcinc_022868 [Petrolisthes cinctipes]|uniref:Uncharacterized protein n=1 Tax=Petrolisthes cinctipes TaxID=88211 RepID=A0AAE1FDW2_PETCI|nr:hypothetical protein Pcinc_022868 [Petrolisthes cinctipes]